MKIYDQVVVLGEVVPVKFCDSVPENENANFIDDDSGMEIRINPSCKKRDLARSFIHEFLHVVCARGSISQSINEDLEEVIVDLMAKALTENFHIRFK